ncbi:M23 family metallopeptidase [Streptomyces sp. NPDC050418]|uniref:M23 family metallopeptidase n=1 Tax=Streptomyces sp. NPDC050418 TaxID=3365612 RepID=UPI0037B04C4D
MATPAGRGSTSNAPYFADGTQEFRFDDEPWEEWNPTEESIRPPRGKHRVAKQRGGLARSSTVLGVGVIAAVGAGGIATAKDKPPVPISMPDLGEQAKKIPVVGDLISDDSDAEPQEQPGVAQATGATLPVAAASSTGEQSTADAGEALRARILEQAQNSEDEADAAAQAAAEQAAAEQAAKAAAEKQEAAEKAEAEAKRKAEEEAKRKAEAERLAKLAKSYSLPVASYTITSTFGQAGSMWASGSHTGLDFAASSGAPIKSVHTGTVKEAGWSGSYGYRTVVELSDGTEIAYNHQSSILVNVGQKVTTGDTIGRVGSTGNSTGAHLHLEVETSGGSLIDPMAWLQSKGLTP